MRAFVAAEITDPRIIGGVASVCDRLVPEDDPKSVRLVDTGKLHFTLQFLGEVSDAAVGRISDALCTVRFAPFDLTVGGVGAFPSAKSPRAVWVGVEDGGAGGGSKALRALAQKVAGALGPLGYASDRPFRPHSTIFRVKRDGRKTAERLAGMAATPDMDAPLGTQRVDRFKLKKSVLTPGGPVYTDLAVVESTRDDAADSQASSRQDLTGVGTA